MRNIFRTVSFSAPSSLIREMQEVAKKEHRTISELLRECFRQYSSIQRLRELGRKGRKATKAKGITKKDIGHQT